MADIVGAVARMRFARTDAQAVIDKQVIRDLQNYYSYTIDSGAYNNLDAVFLPGLKSGGLRLPKAMFSSAKQIEPIVLIEA